MPTKPPVAAREEAEAEAAEAEAAEDLGPLE
jgi:hypothetical protein